jgi:hypothetical protein
MAFCNATTIIGELGFLEGSVMNTNYVPIWPTPEEHGPKPR